MQSRIFKGPQFFVTRHHLTSRTWPIKVALIDVSVHTKISASQVRTRLQKRKKVITKFSIIFPNAELYFSLSCESGLTSVILGVAGCEGEPSFPNAPCD